MKLYIRNRARYNPGAADQGMIEVLVENYADTYIWQVKESAKRQRASKLDELFHFSRNGMERLEDGRTVAHYNLADGDVLDSTSNPFFAVCMYILAIEATRTQEANPEDKTLQEKMRKSYIRKYTILGVLFNSSKDAGDTQPAHFSTVEQFVQFVKTHPKKGVEMTHFTEQKLWQIWREYTEVDIQSPDPVEALVSRYRERLRTVQDHTPATDGHWSDENENHLQITRTSKAKGGSKAQNTVKPAGNRSQPKVTRKITTPRCCENCDLSPPSSVWCPECEGGIALCDTCNHFLHMRRKHPIRDISEVPRPSKQYVPHAYRAPFALLVGLYTGYLQEPKKISMTEEELREAAQGLTDTDLFDKAPGKVVGGFEIINNLISKKLVIREATNRLTYALRPAGVELAKRLMKYHNAVISVMKENSVPCVPELQPGNLKLGGSTVQLLVDEQERQKERMVRLLERRGIESSVKGLPTGDYVWTVRMGGTEMVFPCVVERKTWDDLNNSLRDGRFRKQLNTMKRLDFSLNFYLIEGSMTDMRSKPTEARRTLLKTQVEDLIIQEGFYVNYTGSWYKTVEWLTHLTHILIQAHREGMFEPLIPYTMYAMKCRLPADELPDVARVPVFHQWTAEEHVQILYGQTQNNTECVMDKLKERLNLGHRNKMEQNLLVIEGLEAYNKGRQKWLNDGLILAFSDCTKPVKELVRGHISIGLERLVHYDVQQYYSLSLQVLLGVYVVRKETRDETEIFRRVFVQGSRKYGEASPPKDPHEFQEFLNYKAPESVPAAFQNEEDEMLQEAITRSITESQPHVPAHNVTQETQEDHDLRLAIQLSLKAAQPAMSRNTDRNHSDVKNELATKQEQIDLKYDASRCNNIQEGYAGDNMVNCSDNSPDDHGSLCIEGELAAKDVKFKAEGNGVANDTLLQNLTPGEQVQSVTSGDSQTEGEFTGNKEESMGTAKYRTQDVKKEGAFKNETMLLDSQEELMQTELAVAREKRQCMADDTLPQNSIPGACDRPGLVDVSHTDRDLAGCGEESMAAGECQNQNMHEKREEGFDKEIVLLDSQEELVQTDLAVDRGSSPCISISSCDSQESTFLIKSEEENCQTNVSKANSHPLDFEDLTVPESREGSCQGIVSRDEEYARKLQQELNQGNHGSVGDSGVGLSLDEELARQLQDNFDKESSYVDELEQESIFMAQKLQDECLAENGASFGLPQANQLYNNLATSSFGGEEKKLNDAHCNINSPKEGGFNLSEIEMKQNTLGRLFWTDRKDKEKFSSQIEEYRHLQREKFQHNASGRDCMSGYGKDSLTNASSQLKRKLEYLHEGEDGLFTKSGTYDSTDVPLSVRSKSAVRKPPSSMVSKPALCNDVLSGVSTWYPTQNTQSDPSRISTVSASLTSSGKNPMLIPTKNSQANHSKVAEFSERNTKNPTWGPTQNPSRISSFSRNVTSSVKDSTLSPSQNRSGTLVPSSSTGSSPGINSNRGSRWGPQFSGEFAQGQCCDSTTNPDTGALTDQQGLTERQSNMTCGSCGQKGHNRKWRLCPNYYSDQEIERREMEQAARRNKREQEKRERDNAIHALENERDNMVERLRTTQDQYRNTIGNIDTLIRTIHKPSKKRKK